MNSFKNDQVNVINKEKAKITAHNASEVIRAGLRLLDDEENQIIVLQKSIQEGMDRKNRLKQK